MTLAEQLKIQSMYNRQIKEDKTVAELARDELATAKRKAKNSKTRIVEEGK